MILLILKVIKGNTFLIKNRWSFPYISNSSWQSPVVDRSGWCFNPTRQNYCRTNTSRYKLIMHLNQRMNWNWTLEFKNEDCFDLWRIHFLIFWKLCSHSIANLQCTWTMILFDTGEGMPLDAMHRYGPISALVTRFNFRSGPFTVSTKKIQYIIKFFFFYIFRQIIRILIWNIDGTA